MSPAKPVVPGVIEEPLEIDTLKITDIPPGRTRGATEIKKAIRARRPDYLRNHDENQKLGLLGELLVLHSEKKRLKEDGVPELAAKIRHVSVLENDTAGYDILSFESDGTKRYIEVKTTRGSADADFFMSANELAFANRHSGQYQLYRLYDYVDEANSAKCFMIKGDPKTAKLLQLVPTEYKVSIYATEE